MLEYIKSDKYMTMSHWRYQLLHWVFNIPEEDRTVKNSPLPKYLYTHYCPIFHLTNLLVLISPFIMLYRLSKAFILFFSPVLTGIKLVFSKIDSVFVELARKRQKVKEEQREEYKKTKEYAINLLKGNLQDNNWVTWEAYKCYNITQEEFLTIIKEFEEQQQKILDDEAKYRKEREELLEKKRAAWQKRITFWVNFSRPLIKGLLNLLYGCIFLLSAYVLFLITPYIVTAVLWFIGWLFSISFYKIFMWIWMGIKLLLIGLAMILTARTMWKYAPQKQIKNILCVPSDIFLDALGSFGDWIEEKFTDTKEFIKMFYKENCPPVIIDEE